MFRIKKSPLINKNTIDKSKYKTWYNYCSNDPHILLEDILGTKLKLHQKAILKLLTKINRIKDQKLIKKDIVKCPICRTEVESEYLFKTGFGIVNESYSCDNCGYSHNTNYGYCKDIIDGEIFIYSFFDNSDDGKSDYAKRGAAMINLHKKYRK